MQEQILSLHSQGYNASQISRMLGCGRSTVKYHIDPAYKRATNLRTELSRAKKRRIKEQEKAKFPIQPKAEKKPREVKVKEDKSKKEPAKRRPKKKASNPNDKKNRVFKNKELKLKEKIAVNLMDSKNTIVYTSNPKYDIKELQKKYLGKII